MRVFLPPVKRFDESALALLGLIVEGPRWGAISITGRWCALRCKHCNAVLLEYMDSVTSESKLLEWLASRGYPERVLVSGGCDEFGRVPLPKALPLLRKLRELGLRLYVHTGLLDEPIAAIARELGFEAMMFDVFSVECAKLVRNLRSFSERRIVEALELCEDLDLPCVPHIVVGELCGKPSRELELVDLLASYSFPQINIVVFTPLPGTPFEECSPPPPSYVLKVMARARDRLSGSKLALGCMKPQWGSYRRIELAAIDMGFDAIASPSLDTLSRLARKGVSRVFRGCCSVLARDSVG